ncbi:IS5 family transposase [Rhizobium dioscoreae]|uniref:IS5 family transposase n=1 Tax=Rhizobium dioscoreae TaxID=2653122 RepID=UPI0012609A73|nr:IS5 family transposase [Rhizobium dioscoreae]
MSDLFLLSERQMALIEPYFPLAHGIPRVDDRRVISGIVYVIKHGMQWKDAPKDYGPHKTLYNRFIRWSRLGVFDRIFAALTVDGAKSERIMIDATHLKAHRTAASLLKKGMFPRRIGRTKGGLNSKLHTVCDDEGRPIVMLLSEGQMSDHKGARLVLDALPPAKVLIADLGYDSTPFREALQAKGIEPCIPSSRSRKVPYPYDKTLYRKRHKVENLFAKLKDWRRIATRYDRCAHTFFSAICIAATVIFWL